MTKEQYSPSTQAVKDAVLNLYKNDEVIRDSAWKLEKDTVIVVLRALVDEIMPIEYELFDGHLQYEKSNPVRDQILSIANELEELEND
jgi:hypothetical protein